MPSDQVGTRDASLPDQVHFGHATVVAQPGSHADLTYQGVGVRLFG